MLESLTPKQEKLAEQVAEEYIKDLTVSREPDLKAINRWLDVAYRLYDMKRPERVEVVDSPQAGLKLATELTGEKQTALDWCGVGDGGWVAFYDYFHRIGVLTKEEAADVLALREFGKVAWDSILLDECAIVVRRPKHLRVDDEGNLHSVGAPCIEWFDGEKDYAYHGTWVTEKIAMRPREHTKEEYLKITNTEQRRALGENAGWEWVARLLGAKSVNKWTDKETKLHYELLRCEDKSQILKKESPTLKNREQPFYYEPVHEDLKTAQAARKWQATSLSVEECERNPSLTYGIEA